MLDESQDIASLDDDYEPDLITLEDDNGEEHTFEVLDAAEYEDERYLAVVPYSQEPSKRLAEDAEMLIMRIGEENGDEYLDLVEDEDELYQVGQMFINRLSEVYDIDLEELERQLQSDDDL